MALIFGIIGIFLVWLLFKLIRLSLRVIRILVFNGVFGLILLYVVNWVVQNLHYGKAIEMEPKTALLAGFLGIPYIVYRWYVVK